MNTGDVLVVTNGLGEPHQKKQDNLILDYRGIPDIIARNMVTMMRWDGYAKIGETTDGMHDSIVSEDPQRVIEKVREKLSKLDQNGLGDTPLIIESKNDIPGIPTTYEHAAIFLVRRFLDSPEDYTNERKIALVRKNRHISPIIRRLINYYKKRSLIIVPYLPGEFLEDLIDKKERFDQIYIPKGLGYSTPIDVNSLMEDSSMFDGESEYSRALKGKKPFKRNYEFCHEQELQDDGYPTFLDLINIHKGKRCGEVWTDGYRGQLTELTVESLVWGCHLDINIPKFLDNCPRV